MKSLPASKLGWRRGVLQPLVVKSMRMRRTESVVKDSRQNGQAGERREVVFSTMVLQQLAQSTCPAKPSKNAKKVQKKREKKHTAGNGMGQALGAILFCADVAGRTGFEGEHGASRKAPLAVGTQVRKTGRRGNL